MLLSLPPDDPRPLYRQIASAVRRGLAEGELEPGSALPAGRDLASALGVNLDTVQRAYRLLADEGLVTARVGRGTRIVEDPPLAALELQDDVERLVSRARALGVGLDELRGMVTRAATS